MTLAEMDAMVEREVRELGAVIRANNIRLE